MSGVSNKKEHYDVGIFGVWSGCNYGSIATYYALNQVVTSMGKSVLMIDKPVLRADDAELKETHSRRFGQEHYNISKQYKLGELHELNNLCDTFIIGSDQVWNYGISKNFGKAFYLDFAAEEKKKIAYAISFGHSIDFAPVDERFIISEYMSFFDGIGTREADGVRLCKEDYGIKAEQVLDPVFLADPKIYDALIEKSSQKEEGEFIVSYILDPTPEKREAILHLQKEFGNVKVINLLDGLPWLFEKNKKLMDLPNCIENLQVEDWLYYLKNAKFILTDSCHGASFALIFKKNFIAMANKRRGFSRFTSLAQLFKFEDHLITNPKDVLTNPQLLESINYDVVENIMEVERKRCYKWLYDVINLPKKNEIELKERNIIGKVNLINKNIIPKPADGTCDEKTVLKIVNDKNCSGCGACETLCPKNAIKLCKNTEGFWVPNVNRNKCINCGLCLKKCTSQNPTYNNNIAPKCYAMMASDEIRKISSSGGMFTVAAEYILEQGGYVCGAAYKKDFTVEHIIINDKNELGRLRGSKYIQSYASRIFSDIKELLKNGKLVLFTGMPCQIAGLYSYLGKNYDTLYTMDLLCHGITSFKVFEKYHKDILNGKQLKRLEFKEKEPWGWHAGVNAYFTDETKYSKPLESDLYFIAYLKSIAKNTTCEKCASNKLPRQGDLTIGDFWGIARYDEEVYDKKGTSVVLINNQKAEKFFEKLKPRMEKVKEEPLSVAISGNHIIQKPYRLHKNRNDFFKYFDKLDFKSLTLGCYHNELYKYVKLELLKVLPEELHEYFYLAKTAAEKSKGRKIVTWIESEKFEKVLKDFFGLKVSYSVAKTAGRVNNETIYPFSNLKGHSGEIYVVALDPKKASETYKILQEYGYNEIEDFICRFPNPIVIKDYDCAMGRYEDAYGNTIEGYTGKIKSVIFRGCNNHIIIGDKVTGVQNLTFDLTANAYIEIERENRINAENRFVTRGFNGKSEVIVKRNCRLTNVLYRLYNSEYTSSIHIGEECTFESNIELHANSGKKIIIGRDCMFSHDIDMWAGDGHSIFDVTTGQNINSVYEKQLPHRNAIIIGEHVWVGKGAFIMHGTNIGTGSLIGAKSVVKGQFPNNCTISGNPARLVRKNCAWSRIMTTESITDCGKSEYYAMTREDKITKRKVLILGGTGRMSSKLTALCIANGDDVTIAVRGKHKIEDEFASVKKLLFDRLNEEQTKNALKGDFYDVIFDCSAFVPQSVDWVLANVKTNRYIYVSSFGVYVERKCTGCNVNEDDLPLLNKKFESNIKFGSKGWYSKGKYNAEVLLSNKYSNINYAIVRIPFAMSEKDDFNDDFANRILKYVSAIINEEAINETNLESQFNFVESSDEAQFLYYLSKNNFKGVVNFASQGSISMKEVIEYVEEQTGIKARYNDNAEPFPFTKYPELTMDLSKCDLLKYTPMKLDDWLPKKIDSYIEYCKKN